MGGVWVAVSAATARVAANSARLLIPRANDTRIDSSDGGQKNKHHVSQVMLLKRLPPLSSIASVLFEAVATAIVRQRITSVALKRLPPLSFVASVAFEAVATAIVCRQCCF